ncbi:MAG: cysteine methyltransferase [Micavibrio sp.]|nr:cysteine methyltransferase [Micavibrio sp.]|tara:strand:+ start:796 stop:1308 length:513 start_codon:yes stop_codon:yes gene_type:complete
MQKITYGIHDTELGRIVIGQTDKGLCWLGFMISKEEGAYKGDGLMRMKEYFSESSFEEDKAKTFETLSQVFQAWESDKLKSIPLDLQGTDFQCAVWQVLLNIPRGKTLSYGDVANDIGKPKASRAVGTAVGDNPISLIVPCHRVVQKSGNLGNYGWGLDLKRRLLEIEAA